MSEIEPNVAKHMNASVLTESDPPVSRKRLRDGNNGEDDEDSKTRSAKKKLRVLATTNDEDHSILLNCNPEILRHIYSFLSLRETLVVRKTCRTLNTGTDAFRYSQLANQKKLGFERIYGTTSRRYLRDQLFLLCNLSHNDKLRAALCNESFGADLAATFLDDIITHSKIDNGEAVSTVLKDGRSTVKNYMLDKILQKGFTSMGDALQVNETIKASVQMCQTCSNNIGCHLCANCDEGCKAPVPQHGSKDAFPKYCRACALDANRFCGCCMYFVCTDCFRLGHFQTCEDCQDICCMDTDDEDNACWNYLNACDGCARRICPLCNVGGGNFAMNTRGVVNNVVPLHHRGRRDTMTTY